MYGGLIKKQPRITKDRHGNVTTEHFSGRQDVRIVAPKVQSLGKAHQPGEEH